MGRRPLVMVDGEDVTHLGWLDCGETICYKGSPAPLYACSSMPISDPPCFRAFVRAELVYEDPDSPTSLPIGAWACTLEVDSMTGLTVRDIMQQVFCRRNTLWYLWRNPLITREIFPEALSTLIYTINVPRNIQKCMGWKRISRRPLVELHVDLPKTMDGLHAHCADCGGR